MMDSRLVNLLSVAENNEDKKNVKDKYSGIILGCVSLNDKEIFLNQTLDFISYYCDDIVILYNNGDEQKETLQNRYKKVNFIKRERNKKIYSSFYFDKLVKLCINDKILVLDCNYDYSKNDIEMLINHNASLVTLLGQSGNVISSFMLFDKWAHKYYGQLLKINARENMDDYLRLSNDIVYLKLLGSSKIKPKTNDQQLDRKMRQYFEFNLTRTKDNLSIVKYIALLNTLKEQIEDEGQVSSTFKLQQILSLSEKFIETNNLFLAFQGLNFIIKNQGKTTKLPRTTTYDELKKKARRILLDESRYYMKNNLERLRYRSLQDVIRYNLMNKQDEQWIKNELIKIRENLKTDNVIFPLNVVE